MTATLLLSAEAFAGDAARVEGAAYRHLFRARRLAVGERLRVVDGGGRARWAEVEAVGRTAGTLRLGAAAPANEPAAHLELLVPCPRPPRAAWLVEKATEVGVGGLRFVASERSPRGLGGARLERLVRVAAGAVEQCGRARLPALSGVHPWAELPALLGALPGRWVLDPQAPARWPAPPPAGPSALLVGPEGGWSAAERSLLAELGCRPLGLGPRTLRLETAAVVGAALLLAGAAGGEGSEEG